MNGFTAIVGQKEFRIGTSESEVQMIGFPEEENKLPVQRDVGFLKYWLKCHGQKRSTIVLLFVEKQTAFSIWSKFVWLILCVFYFSLVIIFMIDHHWPSTHTSFSGWFSCEMRTRNRSRSRSRERFRERSSERFRLYFGEEKTTDLFDKYRAHSKTVHQDHSRLISDLDYRNWSQAEEKNGWLIFKAENDLKKKKFSWRLMLTVVFLLRNFLLWSMRTFREAAYAAKRRNVGRSSSGDGCGMNSVEIRL